MARGGYFECDICFGITQALDGSCRDCNYRREKKKTVEELIKEGYMKDPRARRRPRAVSEMEEDMTRISIYGLSTHVRILMKEAV